MRIFLVCNKKGKPELFILAEFKLFPCKLFRIGKTENILPFKGMLIEMYNLEALKTQNS